MLLERLIYPREKRKYSQDSHVNRISAMKSEFYIHNGFGRNASEPVIQTTSSHPGMQLHFSPIWVSFIECEGASWSTGGSIIEIILRIPFIHEKCLKSHRTVSLNWGKSANIFLYQFKIVKIGSTNHVLTNLQIIKWYTWTVFDVWF